MGFAFLEHDGTLALAHRGGSSEHPENTLESFQAAVDLGYRHVETDVHVSADGVLYAFHDNDLERITGVGAKIADLDSDALDAVDFGETGGPSEAGGYRIPRFETLLDSWPRLFVNVDPKTDAAVEPLVAAIKRHNATERVCIGSFSDRRITHCRNELGPALCTSMGPRELTRLWFTSKGLPAGDFSSACVQVPTEARMPVLGAPAVRFDDPTFLETAHSLGLDVHYWTINEENPIHQLVDLGADGIMTDNPALLRSVLVARNRWQANGE